MSKLILGLILIGLVLLGVDDSLRVVLELRREDLRLRMEDFRDVFVVVTDSKVSTLSYVDSNVVILDHYLILLNV